MGTQKLARCRLSGSRDSAARLRVGVYECGRIHLDRVSQRTRLCRAQSRQRGRYNLIKRNWRFASTADCSGESLQLATMTLVLAESRTKRLFPAMMHEFQSTKIF